MESTSFTLEPFEATDKTDGLALTGEIIRASNTLSICYVLSGKLSDVEIPALSATKTRQERLWEKTCFEYFLRPASATQSHYWEFNLSPSGDWNVFSLSDYRAELKPEAAIATLPFKVKLAPNQLQLDFSVDIAPLIGDQTAQIGISAVLILGGQASYWAIAHPTPQADFHHPDSFTLQLSR